MECRFDALKLAYFHRLRISESKQVHQRLLNDQVQHAKLLHAFDFGQIKSSESKNYYESTFGFNLLLLCNKYSIFQNLVTLVPNLPLS